MNHRDSWNPSNHNLNYPLEVITFQHCIPYIKNYELNHQALAQRRKDSIAACKFFLSGVDGAALLSLRSCVKLKFMRLQQRGDEKHPDGMITDFTEFLNNT